MPRQNATSHATGCRLQSWNWVILQDNVPKHKSKLALEWSRQANIGLVEKPALNYMNYAGSLLCGSEQPI